MTDNEYTTTKQDLNLRGILVDDNDNQIRVSMYPLSGMDRYNNIREQENIEYNLFFTGNENLRVKLDNILLNYENEEDKENLNLMKAQVKLIDFGFACKVSPSGLQYSVLGSPINMDPLILKKLNSSTKKTRQLGYNESADIWSIGTVCYEMLIGRSAFDAEDMIELREKIEQGDYSVPTQIRLQDVH